MSEWKETDIGALPNNWDLRTVDEIKNPVKKSIISGPFGSNISAKYFVETGVPVIRGNNLSLSVSEKFKDDGFVYISDEKAEELRTWATIDDIVFTAVGTIGQVGLITKGLKYSDYIISNKQLRLRVDTTQVLPIFAYYWFSSPFMVEQIIQRNTGSSVPLINLSVLKSLHIPIPPLEEQQAIASILSTLDDKIDLLHRQNQTLEQMAETLFRQWFVEKKGLNYDSDDLYDSSDSRNHGNQNNQINQSSDNVEEVDEGWEVKKLKELVDIGIGRTPPRKEFHWFSKSTTDVRWVSIKDLGDSGVFVLDTSEYLTEEAVEKFNIPIIPPDTVLLSFKMTLGRVAITTEHMLSNEAIAHFKFNNETPFSKEFLYFYLKTYPYETLGSTSSIVTSINSGMIKDMEVIIPDNETLSKFENQVIDYFDKIKSNQTQIRTLTALRDTLLPKLMSGEVRVIV